MPMIASIAMDPTMPSGPPIGQEGRDLRRGWHGGQDVEREDDPERESQPAHPDVRHQHHEEDQRPVRVAFVHRRQEAERHQRRRREPQDQRAWLRVAEDRRATISDTRPVTT